MQYARNCRGSGDQSFAVNVLGEVYTQCPMSFIDNGCIAVVNLINMSTGGFGGSPALPSQLLEETQFFFNVHSLIGHISGEIEKTKKERKKNV